MSDFAPVSRAAKGTRCKRVGFGLRGFESLPGALLLLTACSVYEQPEQCGRAHPGGGVTVKLSELDADGGEP